MPLGDQIIRVDVIGAEAPIAQTILDTQRQQGIEIESDRAFSHLNKHAQPRFG